MKSLQPVTGSLCSQLTSLIVTSSGAAPLLTDSTQTPFETRMFDTVM